MEEAFIHLPRMDNDGNPLFDQHRHVLQMLLSAFGGYTSHEATGAWKDPETERVYVEPVTRVAIAANWNVADNTRSMMGIARFAAGWLRQECIYVAFPSGVEFVPPGDMLAMAVAAE